MTAGHTVAIVDIGSNSIKSLVATRARDGGLVALTSRAIDARISAGISHTAPRLGEEGMALGLAAIRALLAEAAPFEPGRTILVATSAVRDARNGADFRERVRAATGQQIRILTGDEEADLIGRGLTCDPALRSWRNFYVFDLGGGSLECLAFRDRRSEQAVSLQLGCVRLTEEFVADPAQPFAEAARIALGTHVRDVMDRAAFAFALPSGAPAVGTGGTVATARAILGAPRGQTFDATDPFLSLTQLRELLTELGALPLTARKEIPGLPPARADVFPVALAVLIAMAEIGGLLGYTHSLYNLRYGLAAEALEA